MHLALKSLLTRKLSTHLCISLLVSLLAACSPQHDDGMHSQTPADSGAGEITETNANPAASGTGSTAQLTEEPFTEEPFTEEQSQQVKPQDKPSPAALDFQQKCETWLAEINKGITTLEGAAAPYTVERVLNPLNDIQILLFDGSSQAALLEAVHPDKTLRSAAGECTAAFADIGSRIALSRPIYDAVSQVDVSGEAADTRQYHFTTLRGFRLSGVDRDEPTRKKVRELNDKITRLGQEFDRNILEDVRYIEVGPEDLAGLPADFIAARPVGENGKIRLSTRYVDIVPVYTYAHSDDVRRILRREERSRAYPQNDKILTELLKTRYELAQLLGFDSYADLITADKMVGSAANAQAFIKRFHDLVKPAATRDMAQLLARQQQITPGVTRVERWQDTYLEELIRKEKYQVDASELRQYFTYSKVRDGIFALVSNMFEVEIRPWQTDTWHPSVESYEMYRDGKLMARFHLDMHPRDGKYQHAAAFSTQVGIAGKQLPVSTLVCNFAGGKDAGEAMEFSEVRTFLHEFGHLVHALFGGHQRWATLSGIATEWDYVEAPSQMLEEWMYDKDTLQSFAVNSKGETIPDDMVQKLRDARLFGEGLMGNMQIYYSALSLEYHRLNPATFNLLDKMMELEAHYSPMPHQQDTYFYANLGHLNGYSAIYYTYMWSKVIAMDMFSEFEKNGLGDRATASRYRDLILAPGGTKPAAEMVEDFLKRPYNLDAFAKSLEPEKE